MLKIDFSTVILILFLVVPGLVAKKSRRRFSAQSFETAGPAAELGELVAFSLAVHLLLIGLVFSFAFFLELSKGHSSAFYFRLVDSFNYSIWSVSHRLEVLLAVAIYLCLSITVGYILGILYGWFKLNQPIFRWVESSPVLTRCLRHFRVFSVLEEMPLSFELFTGESVSRKNDLIFFLEIRLRNDSGFITGELVKYAVVKDEELHRPVVLRDVYFKLTADEIYQPLEGERVLIDLADALVVQVVYQDRAQALADLEQ